MLEILSFLALVGGFGVWAGLRSSRSILEGWRTAAKAHGLGVEEASILWGGRLRLKARKGPFQVRIENPQRKGSPARIVLVAPWPPDFAGIRIHSGPDKLAGADETGDELFDQAFSIAGPQRLLFALLDRKTRLLMVTLNADYPLEIMDGELRAEMLYPDLPDLLELLFELAHRLVKPMDRAQRLAQNVRRDPNAGMRLGSLLLLAREFPGEPRTMTALHTACADASPKIRLRAAQELGAEGRGILRQLAESNEDDALRAEAVTSLGGELPPEHTREILVQALRRRLHQTARACLERLGGSPTPEDISTLAKVLALEKSELAAAAAQALGATGSPAAEPPLIEALQHERPDACVAAAKALGAIGTAAAVLPLEETAGQALHQELRGAVRQAIAEIQSRLQGASPGQLSLAQPAGGELSLAEAEAGELSLADPADDAKGRLSLPAEESRE